MSNNPTTLPSWKKLLSLAETIQGKRTLSFFETEKDRTSNMSVHNDTLLYDYSKQRVTAEITENLFSLLNESGFEEKKKSLFSGEKINITENASVLHTALRNPKKEKIIVDGENILPHIHDALQRMETLSKKIHAGELKGATGEAINTIVSIGIGGSDLGPRMVFQALNQKYKSPITTHFVSNIDGEDIQSTLKQCDPQKTLFVIISKSFKTQETLTNAQTARDWIINSLPENADIAPHFVTASGNREAAMQFGLSEDNIYPMWEWVTGRFSLWSAAGLSLSLHFGYEVFHVLLDGAYNADQHFLNEPNEKNIPVIMALLGIWNRNFLQYPHTALLPYREKLKYMPSYIQQLEMESNGKNIDKDGNHITNYDTAPITFGEIGTNGQHSFYQLLHQGTIKVPCDFIGVIKDDSGLQNHHNLLLSNMLAQGQAMLQGRLNPQEPHLYFDGNAPSSTFLFTKMDAHDLGYLIALFEHKTFVQGAIWNINSFDQYGVELGKELAHKLESNDLSDADPSTKALISHIHKAEK
ncbi:MAG: glucose-6-phosphate isomerase [Pseudomonadota bacterium]